MHVIDRRQNPKSKNLGNRQRFLRRVRSHLKEAVSRSLKNRKVADIDNGQEISISSKDLSEPSFQQDDRFGQKDHILPGNQDYRRGDLVPKPRGGGGGRGSSGSADGDEEDSFAFVLSRDEFLELFFEDLELPNLAKKKLKSTLSTARTRAGYARDGSPQRLNLRETMRRSLSRRIALRRPKPDELERLERECEEADADGDRVKAKRLREQLEVYRRRMKAVPYLDNVDLRYSRFEKTPKPTTQAVMFCLMDTSASMTEELKDLAKRFYMLLHLFLQRHYHEVEIVFIRHTYTAQEVDEQTFFYGRDSGGTVVSSALEEMQKVVRARYPIADWNIYAAQCSDGHNFDHDMPLTLQLIRDILPICQYYAYIEVGDDIFPGSSMLWDGYDKIDGQYEHFARAEVNDPGDIFPVFRKLFASDKRQAIK